MNLDFDVTRCKIIAIKAAPDGLPTGNNVAGRANFLRGNTDGTSRRELLRCGSENDASGDYRKKAERERQRRNAGQHGTVQTRPKFYLQGAASASSTLGKIRKKFSRRAVSRIGRTSSRTPARIKIPP